MASPTAQSAGPDADEDTPMRSDEESSKSGSGSEEEEVQTEWLATTREKRSTAGNRLSTLIQQAAAEDDELELLFAEDEDDVGFEDVDDDASDVQMDSSDDDDDQGPTAGDEELEGEKELQQQARAERQAKKRKLNDGIPKAFRKKVKIDPTGPLKATPPRPKKKSERASWIPTPEEAPTRASARSTTKISKEQLHAQMLDREKRRLRQLEIMEQAAKKKNAEKPKEITQEDRLAEAARVEKKNAKSLNRWEESEKIREEEQRAKLAALHNRKMEGPYMTWWSGIAEWVGGKLRRVGKNVTIEEKQKSNAGRKRKADEMQEDAAVPAGTTPSQTTGSTTNGTLAVPLGPVPGADSTDATVLGGNAQGLGVQPSMLTHAESKTTEVSANTQTPPTPSAPHSQVVSVAPSPALSTPSVLDGSAPLSGLYAPTQNTSSSSPSSTNPPHPRMVPSLTTPFTFTPAPSLPVAEAPPIVEKGTYNCLILENFNENSIKSKDVQCQVLFNKKFPKAQSTFKPLLGH